MHKCPYCEATYPRKVISIGFKRHIMSHQKQGKAQISKEWSEISRGITALSDAEYKAFNQRMMEGK